MRDRLWKWERETPWPFVAAVAASFFVASVFIAMACPWFSRQTLACPTCGAHLEAAR